MTRFFFLCFEEKDEKTVQFHNTIGYTMQTTMYILPNKQIALIFHACNRNIFMCMCIVQWRALKSHLFALVLAHNIYRVLFLSVSCS